ncbi:MAG: hypothetical protein ACOYNI_11120 [Acidimicrobiia bacterium]
MLRRLPTNSLVCLAVAAQAPVTLFGGPQWLRMSLIGVSAVFGWLVLRRADLKAVAVVVAAVVLMVVAVIPTRHSSHDVYSYIMYGRMVSEYQVSPYTHTPADFPDDSASKKVSKDWKTAPSVYGPVFTVISAAGAWMTPGWLRGAVLWHQFLTGFVGAIVLWIVWKRTADPRALAFLVLNPMVGWSLLTDAHNDLLVGLAILGSVAVAAPKPWLSGVCNAFACLVKASAGLAVFAIVATTRKLKDALVIGAVTVGVFVVVSLPFGIISMKNATRGAGKVSRGSLWQGLLRANIGSPELYGTLGLVLCAVFTIAIVIRFRDQILAVGAALASFPAAAAWVLPWYAAWSMPVLALRREHPFSKWIWWHAVFMVEAYQFGKSFGGFSRLLVSFVIPIGFTLAFAWIVFRSPRVHDDVVDLTEPNVGSSLAS